MWVIEAGDGRLALRWWLRAVWKHRCKGQCLHQCKRRCDGASRGDNGPGTAAALVRGTEAGDRRREFGARCGGQRCGAPADIGPGQLYRWRKEFRAVTDGFAQVLIAPPEIPTA